MIQPKLKRNVILHIVFCSLSFLWLCSLIFNQAINNYYNSLNLSKFNNCELKVHFLDVGQADCTIIQLPNNKTMIIDAGSELNNSSTPDYICEYLKHNVLSSNIIDYFVLTHSDEDHCYAVPDIMKKFKVYQV